MEKLLLNFHTGLCYLACALLVIFYVNLFFLYTLIQEQFGDSFIKWAPFVLPPALLIPILLPSFFKNQRIKQKVNYIWIFIGGCICTFALFVPDPQIAVKKIHVSEYILLSLLARYTLSHNYSSYELLFFSAIFTAILGVHDEFLQGLHPSRTYGLRDMAVNICSALGGSFIWHGLGVFSTTIRPSTKMPSLVFCYLAWLIISLAALVIPASGYLNDNIPLWAILPLGASFIIFLLNYSTFQKSQYSHGVSVLSFVSLLFLFYPPLIHVLQTPFY